MQILVVARNELMRELMTEILQAYFEDVVPVDRAHSALALLERPDNPFDLVISDLNLPGLGGAELYGRIRERYPKCKGILMSSYLDETRRRSNGASGNVVFIEKPFSATALVECVHAVTGLGA